MAELNQNPDEALKRAALSWLARFSLGEATEADRAALRHWRDTSPAHYAALAEAARLWRSLDKPVAELVRSRAVAVPLRGEPRPMLSRRMLLAGGATAAAAGLLIVRPPFELWPSLAELSADHRTATGEQRRLALMDSVSVELNTRTSITLRNTEQEELLELISGEAAFTVGRAAARPFVVIAGEGRIRASAATFSVRHSGSDVRLICVAGEVGIACGSRALVLKPAQQVSWEATRLGEVATIDPEIETAWRDGMLVFRDTPLFAVIDEVNRYRSGRIILLDAALGRRQVTARLEISHLDTVMSQIGNTFKVPIRTLPGGIVLVG
jgi:transmembrane sensor